MLARAVMGQILLAMPRLCRPPFPTACEHISKQYTTNLDDVITVK